MNVSKNSKTSNKGGCIIRKATFCGSAISIVCTFAAGSFGGLYGLDFISLPAHYLWQIFGVGPQSADGSPSSIFLKMILLPTLTNAMLFSLIIGFIGFLFSKILKS